MIFLRLVALYLISELFTVSVTELSSPIFNSCHAKFHSCENPLNNTSCNCDSLCKYYDDCCFNADGLIENQTEVTKLQISLIEKSTCENLTFKHVPPRNHGAFMVSSCPASWKGDNDVKNKCEQTLHKDFFDLLPVFDSYTSVTFKNRQCALCNGVHNWIPWLIQFGCGVRYQRYYNRSTLVSFDDEMKLRIKKCKYKFEPSPDIKARYCLHTIKYLSWKFLKDVNITVCRNRVLAPVAINYEYEDKWNIFRNIQCFLDSFDLIYLNKSVRCVFASKPPLTDLFYDTISSLIDISTLILPRESTMRCSGKEIHLSEKIGCKPLYCPTNMEPFGGRCNAITYKTSGITLDLLFETNNINHAFDIINQIIERLVNEYNTVFISEGIDIEWKGDINIIPGYNITSRESCSMVQVRYLLKKKPNRDTTLEYQKSLVKNAISYYQHTVLYSVHTKYVDDVLESLCQCNVSLRNPSFVVDLFLNDTSLPCPAVKVQLHRNYSDRYFANSSESNGTTYQHYFYLSGQRIHSEDVFSKYGSYFLCVDTFKLKYQVVNGNDVSLMYYRSIVNTICTCLSILCLLYSLVQYCAIPFIRQGRSELLFVLMLYLLFAQTSFLCISLVAVANSLCEWIGMLHHFIWIGTFTFMFLCSLRLNFEIRTLTTMDRSERCFETVKYFMAGFLLNVSVVLSTKILNLLIAPTETWYGGDICFISNVYVLLLTFILPISLTLCGNIILFILIILYINLTSISSEKNYDKSKMFILVKISSMMGFSWIIGIIAIFIQSEILLIIFENLSSLQGTFITLSFSCNNRVKTFYSGLCFRNQTTNSTQSKRCAPADS